MWCHAALVTSALALGQATGGQAIAVAVEARAIQPGELVVLTITAPDRATPILVRAFGREWPVIPGAVAARALIGIDLAVTPGRYSVTIDAGREHTVHPLMVKARAFPTRHLKVDPDLVNPPPEALDRIQREARELEQVWAQPSSVRLSDRPFVRPVQEPANSAFGTRSFYNGEARTPHGGADFASPEGTPIKAPGPGRVVLAGSRYFTGGTVVIDHGAGVFSLFAHLSRIDVAAGDAVEGGAVIGLVGATGRVTGPHLHWALRVNGARVDPLSLLSVLGAPEPSAR